MVEADVGYCGEKWFIKVPKDATSKDTKDAENNQKEFQNI